jgi:hypothetical protein
VSPEVVSAVLGGGCRKQRNRLAAGTLTLRVGKLYQVKVPQGFSPRHLMAVLHTLARVG